MFRGYFPKGIAKGEAFFNRTKEIKRLISNLNDCTHSALIAPRRYGKSSLAKQAIAQTNYQYCEIDLFVAIGDIDVGNKIIHGISSIIQQLMDGAEQRFHVLKNFFVKADKKWTIGFKGLQLELIPNDPNTVAQNILDAFEALEFMLTEKNQIAIIYIDEFQEVLETQSGKAIEGAIRHFTQETEHVSFVFSGSSRKLLKKVFNDRSRPLYSLCDEIVVDRIEAKYYEEYLKKISIKTYGKSLDGAVIDRILYLTDRHPRYVYLLCTEIWFECPQHLPTVDNVNKLWHEYIMQKYKDVRIELSSRSSIQIKVLTEVAAGNNVNLTNLQNQQVLGSTSSAIVQALQVLEKLDFVERTHSGKYRVIDPLIRSTLLYAYSKQEKLLEYS